MIEKRISELGLVIPEASMPVASYVSCVKSNNLIYISGQLPKENGEFIKGTLGKNITIEQAQAAAKICGLNLIAQLKKEIIDLDLLKKCVKLTIFVNSVNEFESHALVSNGVSDLFLAIFGEKGKHARSSIGVSSLPFNACVEVEGIFEI